MENMKEEFRVKGEELVEKLKQLIHEGNVRRLIIKDEDGRVYLEIPVTFGVIGAIFAPILAAAGAVAAMVANLKIEVVRDEEPPAPETIVEAWRRRRSRSSKSNRPLLKKPDDFRTCFVAVPARPC